MKSAVKNPVPRYRAVADALMNGIVSGKYPVGSILPGETEVATSFEISRHTARDAMRLIEQAGLITRRRRVGSRVISDHVPMRYNQRIQSLNDLLQYSNASRIRVLASAEVVPDAAQALQLGLKAGAPCMRLLGIRYQRDESRPFAYSEIFLVVGTKSARTRMLDLEAAARELSRMVDTPRLSRIDQTLVAESASKKLAAVLKLRAGTALLKSMRVYVGVGGRVAAIATTWHAGDLFSYSTTLAKAG